MLDILALRAAAAASIVGTLGASATIVDEHSLVPISILIAAVTMAIGVAWKVSAMLVNARRDTEDLKRRIESLEKKLNG